MNELASKILKANFPDENRLIKEINDAKNVGAISYQEYAFLLGSLKTRLHLEDLKRTINKLKE